MNLLTKLAKIVCAEATACCVAHASDGALQKVYDHQIAALSDTRMHQYDLVATNEPIGQTITAERDQLQSVEFAFRVPSLLGGEGKAETLAVKLRAGDINGVVLSSTTPVVLAWPGSIQLVRVEFQFADPPLLQPGQRYALQIGHLGGEPLFEVLSYNPGPYELGTQVYKGASYDDILGPDLWFKTGYLIPEPSTMALFVTGGTLLLLVRRRRDRVRAHGLQGGTCASR